jgi:hypothetical protein
MPFKLHHAASSPGSVLTWTRSSIADAAKPLRDIVAGRLRTRGLADRDTAGNWWLTDDGRRELTSA